MVTKMLRLSDKTQTELKMYMHSWHIIAEDCKYIYWSGGILKPTNRTEWWITFDYNEKFKFTQFERDNTTKEIKQVYETTSITFKDIMDKMKSYSKDGYILFQNETVIV